MQHRYLLRDRTLNTVIVYSNTMPTWPIDDCGSCRYTEGLYDVEAIAIISVWPTLSPLSHKQIRKR